jgi:thiamine-monophosphate kinase
LIGEFEIIARYFTRATADADVVLGVGDDAAVLAVAGHLAVTVDTLVAGVHFPDGMAPNLLG